tara:strand:- start:1015 stop:1992 length:978 start_codon:yes stop_codon:yes gene_type:complete
MKVVVTGGAGFIGSNLVEFLLKKKWKVIVIDNLSTGNLDNIKNFKSKIKFIKSDISKIGRWSNSFRNVDIVFHLAALADIVPSIQKPTNYFKSNVTGTFNIVNVCKKYKVKKLLYSASSSCYGIPSKFPTNEKELINTQYPYALTKRLGEEIVLHWGKVYNLDVASLRLFNVYGPKSRTSGTYGAVFGVFLAQKLNNKPYTVVGNGKQTRDFTYVSDVVNAFYMASKKNTNSKVFNVGSGKTISINKIVEILGGKKIYIPKRPGEPDCTFADIRLIKKELKWSPKINIETGIKLLINEINYWKKAPIWTKSKISKATKDWFKYLK